MRRLTALVTLSVLVLAASGCGDAHRAKGSRPRVHPTGAEAAIAQVKKSQLGRGFRFFPNGPTSGARCLIPGPGLSRGIKGTCQTRVSFAGDIAARPAAVTFTESWPAAKFRLGGSRDRTLQHSWRFKVLGDDRVVLLGDSGYFPPQRAF